jgi:hypothetical protein
LKMRMGATHFLMKQFCLLLRGHADAAIRNGKLDRSLGAFPAPSRVLGCRA